MALLAAVAVACGEQGTRVVDPEPSPPDTTGGGQVQRAQLEVIVTTSGEAAEVGAALGWRPGRLPGAHVTLRRSGSSETTTVQTGEDGEAVIPNLLVSQYAISVARVLDEGERTALSQSAPELQDVNAFGGGGLIELPSGGTSATVDVLAGRPGSLVISEIYNYNLHEPGGDYRWAHFAELYNNTDTVIYLDGKIFGRALFNIWERPEVPCASLEQWRMDLDGLWSAHHLRFPGTGRSYPLGPGEAAVIAQDAIDHSQFNPALPDLSNADFETIGSPDVDNPAVPNMLQAGPYAWDTPLGHGMNLLSWNPVFVAEAGDLSALPVSDLPGISSPRHRRIPRDRILDVVTILLTPQARAEFGMTWCDPVIPPEFDRSPAELLTETDARAIARRVLATLPGGRTVLQRTGTSSADFARAPRSPGTVP